MATFLCKTKLVQLSAEEYLELLEYKLQVLEKAQDEDSSWNYGIEELKIEIQITAGIVLDKTKQ